MKPKVRVHVVRYELSGVNEHVQEILSDDMGRYYGAYAYDMPIEGAPNGWWWKMPIGIGTPREIGEQI